jgi:hypothetical protein
MWLFSLRKESGQGCAMRIMKSKTAMNFAAVVLGAVASVCLRPGLRP